MALYKEVQEYYEGGLEIPDDVTLLFSDDNFGSIRRLPTSDEAKRSGGVGVRHFPYISQETLLIVLVQVLLPLRIHWWSKKLQMDE
jgi:hypothetical protein